MPYLSITTNVALNQDAESALLTAASALVGAELGKPEAYVMAAVLPARSLRFAGSEASAVFIEVKSIGLPRTLNSIASSLTALVSKSIEVAPERIFIVFNNVAATNWAHQGEPFA